MIYNETYYTQNFGSRETKIWQFVGDSWQYIKENVDNGATIREIAESYAEVDEEEYDGREGISSWKNKERRWTDGDLID